MERPDLIRNRVYSILKTPTAYEWQTQGFGMLRCYLGGPDDLRLQVWDQRLMVWNFSPIHDHPWDFTSTIVAGLLFNQRYLRIPDGVDTYTHYPLGHYNERIIVPGPNTVDVDNPDPDIRNVLLGQGPLEQYGPGETYSQVWNELHQTRYVNGTVTLIARHRTRPDGDKASSIWSGDGPWVSARPRAAEENEIKETIDYALRTWF
jgi:hypothetical protein